MANQDQTTTTAKEVPKGIPISDCEDCGHSGWITLYQALGRRKFPRNYRLFYSCKIPCHCERGQYFLKQKNKYDKFIYPEEYQAKMREYADIAAAQIGLSRNADVWTFSYSRADLRADIQKICSHFRMSYE